MAKRKLIWELSKADFRKRFVGSYFGVVWMFIQPIVTVLIYWLIFGPIGFRYIFFNSSGVIPDIFVQSIPLPIIISNDLCIQSRHTCNPPGSVIIFPA